MIGVRPPATVRAGDGPPPAPGPLWTPPRRFRVPGFVLGPLIIALVVILVALGIRAAYGGFSHHYRLTADLPRAGQQLMLGSDVREHGVVIGSVSAIRLIDRRVELTLQIDDRYRVPASSEAVVSLKTLLGAKFVDLRYPSYAGPFLSDGGRIRAAVVGPELEDVLADGVNVLDAIRPADAATVVSTLAEGARGHGEDVARGLVANAALSQLFARTLDPQLRALHDFVVVFGALKSKGVDLNELAAAINQGVPVYASPEAQAQLRAALEAVTPFANNVADLLILNRADWDRLIDGGDRVLGTIAARPAGLRSLVEGLGRYVFRLGGQPFPLGNGSAAAGFANFIGGDSQAQTAQMICAALPVEIRRELPLCTGGLP
jgi:virulence factor Mce-like protein